MLKINEKGNNINLSKDQKNKGLRLTQRKVESKDLGNISMDLSKEEEIMKKTPGLMENSMIENITAMNSIFEQKQSERLMLNNLNKLNKINDSNNDINNSNQTLTNLVGNTTSNSNNNENPLDVAVIIKDSQEVILKKKRKNEDLTNNPKNKVLKMTQRKVESKELGNISMDLSKEEEIMKKTPGLMENSMIENITAMNSIFEQKQSERLMLNNLNNIHKINESTNDINNSNQTLKNLVGNDLSNTNNSESPLDTAVIIKDSQEVIEDEKKKEKKNKKKRKRKKKKPRINKSIILIFFLMIIIIMLTYGLIKTYMSLNAK